MRNTQKVKDFINKYKNNQENELFLLYDYMKICENILYEDEEILLSTIEILKKNIKNWAYKNSPCYAKFKNKKFIEKKDLLNKKIWFVDKINYSPMATSGSLTGEKFHYRRWEDALYFIECKNHYDLVLDEFNIKEEFNVLFFLDIGLQHKSNNYIIKKSFSKNFMENHGIKRKPNIHYVNFDLYKKNKKYFFKNLIEYLNKNKIDVTLSSGPCIRSLCNYFFENNVNIKVSNLLSNTNEKITSKSIDFIYKNKIFNKICDHMRCWDGGATFFTCSHENYHLMDNISWSYELEEKLITTDYFSLASPFINYWNGDYCKIDCKYQRCDCGRLYRDFVFLENRPFLIKGQNINNIKRKLKEYKFIKEIRCSKEILEIVVNQKINEFESIIKEKITKVLQAEKEEIKIIFSIEKW